MKLSQKDGQLMPVVISVGKDMNYSLRKIWVVCPFCLKKENINITTFLEINCVCGAKAKIEIDTSIRFLWEPAKNVTLDMD